MQGALADGLKLLRETITKANVDCVRRWMSRNNPANDRRSVIGQPTNDLVNYNRNGSPRPIA
jgi:hypothetical protein